MSLSFLGQATQPLLEALADSPIMLMHGPRQCGKTTLAQQVAIPLGYEHLSFADDTMRAFIEADPCQPCGCFAAARDSG